jgi:hypothetical protein
MWNTVTQIGSVLSLLAFVVAAGTAAYRSRLKKRVELIEGAAEPERIAMAQTVLDGVAVDTRGLTKAQRYELARDVLQRRADRFRGVLLGSLVLGVVAASFAAYAFTVFHRPPETAAGLHHLRLTVVDAEGHPLDATSVRTSIGGELKETVSGWEIDVAEAALPADRQVTIWAEADGRRGTVAVRIPPVRGTSGRFPVTVRLPPTRPETLRGLVTDAASRAVIGARVSLVGGDEAVTTGPDGAFLLLAGAAAGEEVRLRVVHEDYHPVEQYHLLGGEPARVVLGEEP